MRVGWARWRWATGVLVLVAAACGSTPTQSAGPSVVPASAPTQSSNPPADVASTPSPAMVPTAQASPLATQEGEVVRGWPSTARNLAGTYSWDGSGCSSGSCIVGWMHNGYGSADVEIRIDVPVRAIPD